MDNKRKIKYFFLREVWYFISAALILIIFLEIWSPGLTLVYFNPLSLLFLWLLGGAILLFFSPTNNHHK